MTSRPVYAGVSWMLVTTFFFVCVHATGKYLVASYPVGQVVWGRYFFHLLLAAAVLGPGIRQAIKTSNLWAQLIRSAFMLGATVFYFLGVQLIPLADANAISFMTPIFVVLLAGPVLSEKVGPRRWFGVVCGFAGALIIIRPGSGAMDLAAAYLIASSLCNACYQIATRQLGLKADPRATLFYTALVGTVGASAALPFSWQPMPWEGWALMVLIGAFACAGHFTIIKAYRAAPAAVIAPFNYVNLLWAAGFGFVIFGDLPDQWTIVGASVIVASGLYILHRERQVGGADRGTIAGSSG